MIVRLFPFLAGALLLAASTLCAAPANTGNLLPGKYAGIADKLIKEATHSRFAYDRLAELCDTFGPRFSGSTNLEAAIDWTLAEMKKDGFQNVRGEEVMIPHWVRGEESVEMLAPRAQKLPMLGLGGSIGTPPEGITAPILVVKTFDELKERAAEARGRIVLFNTPFTEYRETVKIRYQGADEASRAGAVASLIRSVGPFSMQTPHTGGMRYADSTRKIPHAAISIEDAQMLQRMQDRGVTPRLRIKMEAKTLPDALSRNVVAEIPGTEHPEQVVIISGHIDSWDVGTGAMDDGGGCLAAWEAARLMLKLELKPRRTIRIVLWTNEENGMRGAKTYRDTHAATLKNHLLAIESDSGVFQPSGFGVVCSEKAMPYLKEIGQLLAPIRPAEIKEGCRGADVLQLLQGGVPAMHLEVARPKYFWFHHTEADTIDKLDLRELQECVAYMAVMSYVVADMPDTLPR
ncbi:MAG: carboxypeptidase Q [Candidatus Binatia bacterium]|jgi:carboxypeptidase Q